MNGEQDERPKPANPYAEALTGLNIAIVALLKRREYTAVMQIAEIARAIQRKTEQEN